MDSREEEWAPTGLRIRRRFTTAGRDPFESITFTLRPSHVVSADGTVLSAAPTIEVPDSWDQVATDILASKYLRKTGVPQTDADGEPLLDADGNQVLGPERSAREAVLRLANAWRIWGEREGYFATEEDAEAFRDEVAYMMITQMAAPNSPQWFNTGLFEAYGIVEDADGNWYFDPHRSKVVQTSHKYERSSANACFILNVEDRLVGPASIMRHIEDSARLFKAGSGVGANYSKIRERGAGLSGGGTSSGVMSFLRVHDRAAGAVKSGGRTRRAAKMVILNVDHPDIEAFVESKVEEERKVAALAAAGYSADFDGEAYDVVAFQNANHSVRISPGFMKAVREDAMWDLTSRGDGSVVRSVPARQLWEKIAHAAWSCADPGLQFDDLTNDWNTVLDIERINGSNPCSEFLFLDNTACNLASLNLVKFWDEDRDEFDIPAYLHAIRLWTIVLEITVAMSHYPTAEVAERSYLYRPLGLGYANIGALLMRTGLAYDSDQARAVIGAMTAILTLRAYETSAEMAAAFGAFEMYDQARNSMQRVIANHRRAAYGSLADSHGPVEDYQQLSVRPYELDHELLRATPFSAMSEAVLHAADRMQEAASMHGVRNSQVTVLAPAGTIGLVMGCDTTGIEPDFALVKLKKLVGGTYLHIVNGSVRPALKKLGYSPDAIDRILVYLIGTREFGSDGPLGYTALHAAEFTESEIQAAEAALATAPDVPWAFAADTIGEDAYRRLGVDPIAGGAALLSAAGFTQADLDEANTRICGHGSLDGAPDLAPEHLAVFDTAVASGNSSRSIHWSGHVKAVAAASPFLSGGVSKTVNMPHDATDTDVRALYEMAYNLGVKSVSVYRDGSKRAQPLHSATQTQESEEGQIDHLLRFAQVPEGMSPLAFYGEHNPPRFRLPSIRAGVTWRFEIAGVEEVYLRSGEYPDGSLGEVFIDWGKPGSTLRGMTSALSIALSQGLQHGVPLERFVRALRDHNFEPHGVVLGHPNLKMARSLIDAVVRILGHHYLHDDSLVQVKGMPPFRVERVSAESLEGEPRAHNAAETAVADEPSQVAAEEAETAGRRLYGEYCPTCGSDRLVKTGTCAVCVECGATTGCS